MLQVSSMLALAAQPYNFLSVGDWGGVAIGKAEAEYAVAKQMATVASAKDAQLVLNAGDNFYWCGVKSLDDDLFTTDYENVFNQSSLAVPWYNSLGNHDYGYSVEAQLQYRSPLKDRWIFPGRYYARRIELAAGQYMSVIVLDTNPCVRKYRSDEKSGWDPCNGDYPGECPDCRFHENIVEQQCEPQLEWFKDQLAAVPKGDWLVVMGHHPIFEVDVADFTTPLLDHGFHLYINGHSHYLNAYSMDGVPGFLTSGAGTMVALPDDRVHAQELEAAAAAAAASKHSHKESFYRKVAGFTSHTFNADFTQLTTDFITYDGEVINTYTVDKN